MTQQPLTVCGSKNIYLDHNATTPVATAIKSQAAKWIENWGNPSSIHWSGRDPKALIRQSRKQIANSIYCKSPLEIIFTSGGSESNNLAVFGVFKTLNKLYPEKNKIITSSVEHPSVLKAMEALQEQYNLELIKIPVNRQGKIDLDSYKKHLDSKTAFVSIMFANNETGSCFPIKEMAAMAKAEGAFFHTDAVQALGKVPLNVVEWGVDLASFSAHKFYSLKGGGFLYVKQGTPLASLIYGGGQERGRRAGTENLLSIVAMAEMTKYLEQLPQQVSHMKSLRDYMEEEVSKNISGVEYNGRNVERIPNTSSLLIDEVDGESLLMNLDIKGYSVSTGAACSSGNPEPSPVLLAMGCTRKQAQSSLRVSLGWTTMRSDIDGFVRTLKEIVDRQRKVATEVDV